MEQMVQRKDTSGWQVHELNGGLVETGVLSRFLLPAGAHGYANAQIDDYSGRAGFIWRPGTELSLRARFSHGADALMGTAGFGFWNAPYGDPTRRRLALPRAAWFFFGSAPNDLPFAPASPGRGWFAATIDATTLSALAMIPLAPAVLALNQAAAIRRRLWPAVRRRLGIDAAFLAVDMRQWHGYSLRWRPAGCRFTVDGQTVLDTSHAARGHAPRGALGFVCWLDNQYLVLTPRGRFRAGTLTPNADQWMEVANVQLSAG
jgi:hypothetical protein